MDLTVMEAAPEREATSKEVLHLPNTINNNQRELESAIKVLLAPANTNSHPTTKIPNLLIEEVPRSKAATLKTMRLKSTMKEEALEVEHLTLEVEAAAEEEETIMREAAAEISTTLQIIINSNMRKLMRNLKRATAKQLKLLLLQIMMIITIKTNQRVRKEITLVKKRLRITIRKIIKELPLETNTLKPQKNQINMIIMQNQDHISRMILHMRVGTKIPANPRMKDIMRKKSLRRKITTKNMNHNTPLAPTTTPTMAFKAEAEVAPEAQHVEAAVTTEEALGIRVIKISTPLRRLLNMVVLGALNTKPSQTITSLTGGFNQPTVHKSLFIKSQDPLQQ